MEERKLKEIEYYDKHAAQRLGQGFASRRQGDFEGFEPLNLSSYRFVYELLKNYCKPGTHALDYGCGNGIHSVLPASLGAKVVGIDLSELSLAIAKKRVEEAGVADRVSFSIMDCESLEFEDNFFDIVFDGGTFSSLDLHKAFPEIARVLKADGVLIGIETLGHNPITNWRRNMSKRTGRRTQWAAEHIFQMKDLGLAREYFGEVNAYFFHLFSWMAFPFAQKPGGKIFLKILQALESPLFHLPFLQPYCFKIVFLFQSPKR